VPAALRTQYLEVLPNLGFVRCLGKRVDRARRLVRPATLRKIDEERPKPNGETPYPLPPSDVVDVRRGIRFQGLLEKKRGIRLQPCAPREVRCSAGKTEALRACASRRLTPLSAAIFCPAARTRITRCPSRDCEPQEPLSQARCVGCLRRWRWSPPNIVCRPQ